MLDDLSCFIEEPITTTLEDPARAGVHLSAFAAGQAHANAGFMIEESLEFLGIQPSTWEAAEGAWLDALEMSARGDKRLLRLCDTHRMRAQDEQIQRVIEPLDSDLSAWLSFFQAFSSSGDGGGFLDKHQVTDADFFWLTNHWQAQLARSPELRRAALVALQWPSALPEIRTRPPVLRRVDDIDPPTRRGTVPAQDGYETAEIRFAPKQPEAPFQLAPAGSSSPAAAPAPWQDDALTQPVVQPGADADATLLPLRAPSNQPPARPQRKH
jgi:hypothetical protein